MLHSGIIPEEYKDVIKDIEVKEITRKVKREIQERETKRKKLRKQSLPVLRAVE